jgi:hypothetical protein
LIDSNSNVKNSLFFEKRSDIRYFVKCFKRFLSEISEFVIASSVVTIACRLGMRAAATKTIGRNNTLTATGQKPYAKITRGNNTYYFNGRGNAYWSNHFTNVPVNDTPSGMHWHASFGNDQNHIYSYIELLWTLIFGG